MSDSPKRGGSESTDWVMEPTIMCGRPLGDGHPECGIPRGIGVRVKKASVDPPSAIYCSKSKPQPRHLP